MTRRHGYGHHHKCLGCQWYPPGTALIRIIHERFCCNRRDGSQNPMRSVFSCYNHAKGSRPRKRSGQASGQTGSPL
jgi:hypothetical protein